MGTGKVKNIFNPAKLDCADNIGAYLRSSDGTLLTHTTFGAVEALDVNIANTSPLDIDVDGVYSGGNLNPDNVGAIFHSRAASPGDAEQTFRSTGASPSSDDVAPANVHAIDVNSFLMGYDGTNWDRLLSTANGLKVDIGDSIEIETAECHSDVNTEYIAVDDTLNGVLLITANANRCGILLKNDGDERIWIKKTNDVTFGDTAAYPLDCGEAFESRYVGAWYGIADSGSSINVAAMEYVK